MTPYSPLLTHCIRVYSILIHTGGGRGGELLDIRLAGQYFTKPVHNTNMTDCISSLLALLNTLKDDIYGLVSLYLLYCILSYYGDLTKVISILY